MHEVCAGVYQILCERLPSHNPGLSATVKALLTTVCKPMYNMILKWIFDGTLEDPFTEFFIAADVQVMNKNEICQRIC